MHAHSFYRFLASSSSSPESEMSAATLIRTFSSLRSPDVGGDSDTGSGVTSLRRTRSARLSPRPGPAAVAIHLDSNQAQQRRRRLLRRARSDADLVVSECKALDRIRSPNPSRVLEEDEEEERDDLGFKRLDLGVGMWPKRPPAPELEVEFSGGGMGKGRMIGGGRNGGGDGEKSGGDQNESGKIGEYYQQMLQADPSNPLLLRNYGRYLHEVEGDAKAAEEYYGRAILASPDDGEVLSLYGNLLWETNKDGERAESYFERAVEASPDDCFVLGSYANFLWDAEEEEEMEEQGKVAASSTPLVKAF